jgi:hypothetical protein
MKLRYGNALRVREGAVSQYQTIARPVYRGFTRVKTIDTTPIVFDYREEEREQRCCAWTKLEVTSIDVWAAIITGE